MNINLQKSGIHEKQINDGQGLKTTRVSGGTKPDQTINKVDIMACERDSDNHLNRRNPLVTGDGGGGLAGNDELEIDGLIEDGSR